MNKLLGLYQALKISNYYLTMYNVFNMYQDSHNIYERKLISYLYNTD